MIKILVIQLGGPADLLLSTLLLRCLKNGLPDVELHYLLHHTHANILATNPYIDHLHQLHFNRQTTVHELRPQNFDHVLDLQTTGTHSDWQQELGVMPTGVKQKGWKAFFNNFFSSSKTGHPAEQYLQMATALGIVNDDKGLDFFIPKEAEVPYRDIPASHHAGFIAIVLTPEGDWAWPENVLEALCNKIDHPVILMGTQNDAAVAENIKSKVGVKIYNACGKFSIYETADLVRKAKLILLFQPYYIQLGAALKREMVVLTSNGLTNCEPYYNKKNLKSLSSLPYDSIHVRPHQFIAANEKTTGAKTGKEQEKLVTQILQTVVSRLRPKA